MSAAATVVASASVRKVARPSDMKKRKRDLDISDSADSSAGSSSSSSSSDGSSEDEDDNEDDATKHKHTQKQKRRHTQQVWAVLITSTEVDRKEGWQAPKFPEKIYRTELQAKQYVYEEVKRLLHEFIDENVDWLLGKDLIDTRMYDEVDGHFRLNKKHAHMSMEALRKEIQEVVVDAEGGWCTLWFKIKCIDVQ